ncbi:MAG TPA: response regulator [Verrucomicrobiae bacterium]|nr:response regulator [Verrucomicrobiae bacterium]
MNTRVQPQKPALLVFHVNDSTDDQVLFQMAAKKAGVPFSWCVVDSAQKAIDYFEALLRLSDSQSVVWPDLVVLDVVMPHQSGFKVLQYLKANSRLRRLPVIVFTGQASPDLMTQAYGLGANSFIAKPPDLDGTVSLVSSLYHTWSAAQRPSL